MKPIRIRITPRLKLASRALGSLLALALVGYSSAAWARYEPTDDWEPVIRCEDALNQCGTEYAPVTELLQQHLAGGCSLPTIVCDDLDGTTAALYSCADHIIVLEPYTSCVALAHELQHSLDCCAAPFQTCADHARTEIEAYHVSGECCEFATDPAAYKICIAAAAWRSARHHCSTPAEVNSQLPASFNTSHCAFTPVTGDIGYNYDTMDLAAAANQTATTWGNTQQERFGTSVPGADSISVYLDPQTGGNGEVSASAVLSYWWIGSHGDTEAQLTTDGTSAANASSAVITVHTDASHDIDLSRTLYPEEICEGYGSAVGAHVSGNSNSDEDATVPFTVTKRGTAHVASTQGNNNDIIRTASWAVRMVGGGTLCQVMFDGQVGAYSGSINGQNIAANDWGPFDCSLNPGDYLLDVELKTRDSLSTECGETSATSSNSTFYDVVLSFEAARATDLDQSDIVGFGDLTILLSAWGECPEDAPCAADFDSSGSVGFADLTILLGDWG